MDDDFTPDPPTPQDIATDDAVASICDDLTKAKTHNAAWYGSHAIYRLQNRDGSRTTKAITAYQADKLQNALSSAKPALLSCFEGKDRQHAAMGIAAVQALIERWAVPQQDGVTRRPAVEIQASARWLRNALHNVDLIGQLTQRAEQRRSTTIEKIKVAAGGWE